MTRKRYVSLRDCASAAKQVLRECALNILCPIVLVKVNKISLLNLDGM